MEKIRKMRNLIAYMFFSGGQLIVQFYLLVYLVEITDLNVNFYYFTNTVA